MNSPKTCVVIVPANYGIEPVCERGLRGLEAKGYPVWRVPGFASIDQARNQMATDALANGFEELFWLDADMQFDPAALDVLRTYNLPIVAGLYPKRGQRKLSCSLLPETTEITFGQSGGLLEIQYAATGFLLTRREVYENVQKHWNLPACNAQFGRPMTPFFQPLIVETENGPWYLSEDFAFSHRARAAGYKIYADTTIRLGHIGSYSYSWEDAGSPTPRYASYKFRIEGG